MKETPSGGIGELGLKDRQNEEPFDKSVVKPISADRRELLRDLYSLPGNKILDRILEHKNPQEIVQRLPCEDFFWLVKKVGEDDCFPLLELGSVEQWEYLLDLEIWRKGRLDAENTSIWIRRLQQADCSRLVRWLYDKGEDLACYHFFKSIEVVVTSENDQIYDLPEGFFSPDGVFHIRVIDSKYRDTIENIIQLMASEDFERYQSFILRLAGVLPAELEEEMYRLRNVRLAEHGFLPFEEAISIYAPLDPEALNDEKTPELADIFNEEEIRTLVPVSPLYHAGVKTMLTEATSRITDPLFLDRIRLEFAGLCNQILSADGPLVHELDTLTRTCRKAAGYLNLALERLCGRDIPLAEKLLRKHSLISLFRVGFGLALKLRWETERWLKGSWFHTQGLETGFWGERWGGTVSGLLGKIPQFYTELKEGEEYRDFEWLSELGECLKVLRRLMVLDSLLERLTRHYKIDQRMIRSSELTFHPLLFNLWGRLLMKLEPGFSGISLEHAKGLFRKLRAKRKTPPYRVNSFEETFIKDFMTYASTSDPEAASILKETLALLWREFGKEYEWVSLDDLDGRYSKFITITTSPEFAPQ